MALSRVVLALSLLVFSVCVSRCVGEEYSESPVRTTAQGDVRGKVLKSHSGRKVYSFLGLPYAKPPVGDLRFSHPRKPDPWEGVRDATEDRSRCPQLTFAEHKYEGSENCLFLNIYTTWLPESTMNVNVSIFHEVVVLFHGGGFTHGSGDSEAFAPDHLLDHDIVLVTINYRLGPLGFLATDDKNAVGNWGLKDQAMALMWVRANILEFGGNPVSMTLMGSQAGGTSAHLHILSFLTKEIFKRAISISGTALSPWGLVDGKVAAKRAQELGKLVGCSKKEINNNKLLIKCLRKQDAEELIKAAPQILEWKTDYSYPFVPVVEHFLPDMRPFIHEHPSSIMDSLPAGPHRRWEKPWLIGVVSHEGLPQALQAMVYPYIMNNLNEQPENYVPLFLGMEVEDKELRQSLGRQIWEHYMKNETLSYSNLKQLAEMVADYSVYRGVFKSVALQTRATAAPVYVYRFSFNRHDKRISLGVPQGEDMEYMFPNVIAEVKREYTDLERPAIDKLISIVANFAKHGDPTPVGNTLIGEDWWPEATSDSFEFVDIDTEFKVQEGFYQEGIKFWDQIEEQSNKKPVHDEL